MASKIIFSNLSRNDDYTILLNGQIRDTILPLKTNTIDVEPGEYELDVKGSNEEGLPSMCKPIQVKIGDGKTVHLKIVAQHFAIGIFDEKGTQLNEKHGFLCGYVADGVHIDNPIS
ncbi:MAG: hypothetical protein NTW65_01865 [Deltaproteobacteria bacterium]|nr:hypothetical protein [Deltaproteobacteria bacterium]